MMDEQTRCRASAGDGYAHAQVPIRGGAPQFGGNRARVAEQAGETSQIEHDLARPAHLEPRRKLARHLQQHVRRRVLQPRKERQTSRGPPSQTTGHGDTETR